MQPVQGLHHITAVAGNAQTNIDFYHKILGQRLVKKTINFDDPGTYHLYYGDEIGTPGTIMTYFPWKNMRRGVKGNGETAAVAYTIRPESLSYWQERLAQHGILTGEIQTRFGAEVLPFSDPDNMTLELITSTNPATLQHWQNGPIPEEHAIRNFHNVTL
jgi:glyoxalase family protein